MKFRNPFAEGGAIHRFRQRSAGFRRNAALDKRLNQLVSNGMDSKVNHRAAEVYELWGDPLDQMGESYLRSCLVEYRDSTGAVLVSGAGLMSLVIGAVNEGSDGREVFCFESNSHWLRTIETWRHQYELTNTILFTGESVNGKQGSKYRIDGDQLPQEFGLILCEGGAGSMSNPVATLKLFRLHLAASFTLIARGVNVDREGPVLMRWASEHGASFVVINKKEGFVKICRNAVKNRQPPGAVKFEAADIVAKPKRAQQVEKGPSGLNSARILEIQPEKRLAAG